MVMPAILPVNAANMAVIVVPRFAPIIIGKTVSTVMIPDATLGTNIEVVTELDWTIAVKIRPINMPIIPLFPKILLNIISVLFAVLDFIIFTINSRAVNNNAKANISIKTPVITVGRPKKSCSRWFTEWTAGVIIAFKGLIICTPAYCPKIFAKNPALRLRYPVANSRGKSIKTIKILKRS